ncbi:MAG: CBS domain-containing protein [Desulfobacterales bacterium]|jgi:CBS-domain-containing membrane protein
MKNRQVRELMVPIADYATIHAEATIGEAILALENENRSHGDKPYRHHSLVVIDADRHVVGRLSQIDIMHALEPRYSELGDARWIGQSVFSRSALVALREKFQLWEQPFEDMCRIMGDVHVRDFMQIPTEGEFVDETDTLNVAIHRIVMGRHHSLLVTRGKEIVGILRSTDLFNTFYEMLAACKAL